MNNKNEEKLVPLSEVLKVLDDYIEMCNKNIKGSSSYYIWEAIRKHAKTIKTNVLTNVNPVKDGREYIKIVLDSLENVGTSKIGEESISAAILESIQLDIPRIRDEIVQEIKWENIISEWIAELKWTPETNQHTKTLIIGNLRGFWHWVRCRNKLPSKIINKPTQAITDATENVMRACNSLWYETEKFEENSVALSDNFRHAVEKARKNYINAAKDYRAAIDKKDYSGDDGKSIKDLIDAGNRLWWTTESEDVMISHGLDPMSKDLKTASLREARDKWRGALKEYRKYQACQITTCAPDGCYMPNFIIKDRSEGIHPVSYGPAHNQYMRRKEKTQNCPTCNGSVGTPCGTCYGEGKISCS